MNKYDDIINLPSWHPMHHPRMPIANRAAQFAPFAALTGHDDAIRETARLTESFADPDEISATVLNVKISVLIDNAHLHPEISVVRFVEDKKKSGGSYIEYHGSLRAVDETMRRLIFTDGTEIDFRHIKDIRGSILDSISSIYQ